MNGTHTRRTFLTLSSASIAGGLAGCTSNSESSENGSNDQSHTTTTTTTESTSTTTERDTISTETAESETDTTTSQTTKEQTTTAESNNLPPEVDLTFEQEEETYFTITHDGGSDITDEATSKVSVVVNGEERFAIVSDDGNGVLDYPYEFGDEVGVNTASPYDSIRIFWHSEDGSEDVMLGET